MHTPATAQLTRGPAPQVLSERVRPHASFCFSGNCLRVEALSNGDMGRRLPNQAGSTIPDIVTGDPSPEDDRGGHAGEILQIDARKMILLPGSCS